MKQVGSVEVPQEAFLAVLNLDQEKRVRHGAGDARRVRAVRCGAERRTARRRSARSSARSAPACAEAMEHVCPNCGGELCRAAVGGRCAVSGVRAHLYLHLPFCAHRCGYCDFVTAVGRARPARRVRRRAARRARAGARRAGAAARDDLPRRRDADVHRAGRARAAARRAAGRRRGDGRGESGDGDARAGPASVTEPCQPCVVGRAELPAAASVRAGAARAARGRPPRRVRSP